MAKVCIDAGHYGKYNRSPVVPEYYESIMNWKLSNKVAAQLVAYGVEVVKTRTNQAADLALEARGKKAAGCDLFLSIHSNASSSAGADHPLACCLVEDSRTNIDEKSVEIGLQLAKVVEEVMQTNGEAAVLRRALNSGADYYGVLRAAKAVGVPAVLLEHSFHTNARAARWLLVDANLDKLAAAEAAAIAAWLGVKQPAQKPAADQLYRVQTGAFTHKDNAVLMESDLQARGFDAFIVKGGDNLYRVQIGAFSIQTNAQALADKLAAAGYEAIIKRGDAVASVPAASVDIDELARRVLRGEFGNGAQRKAALGDLYSKVQAAVNRLM